MQVVFPQCQAMVYIAAELHLTYQTEALSMHTPLNHNCNAL